MSFLQTVGIASQASDAFDDQRQQARMRTQQEQAQQSALDENALYREIVKMTYEHEAQQEAARAAAKAAPKVAAKPPVASVAPIQAIPSVPPAFSTPVDNGQGFANGGEVGGEKFDGIYDDMKVKDRLPTIFHEFIGDMHHPEYEHGSRLGETVGHIVRHAKSFAAGGDVANGVGTEANFMADGGGITNGVGTQTNFANGGTIFGFVQGCMKPAQKAKTSAVKLKGGGPVRGPGTGTSDSVPAVGPGGKQFHLSNGEYVLPADTVKAVGKPALDKLRASTHKQVR